MIKRRRFPAIFFGWWTVLAGGLLALWGHGYYTFGFSALFKPIASELGFSRAATAVPASIGRMEGGFEAPLAGWITDRFGPRWVILLGVFLMGIALILMNFMASLWAFYLLWGVMLGTGVNIALSVPMDTAIANWFVKKRGIAISTKWVFSGLSGVVALPVIAWLLNTQGWRTACLVGGLVMLFFGLPLAWFCVKQHRPEYYGLLPDGSRVESGTMEPGQMIARGVKYAAEVEEVEFTLRQAMKTPTYWLLITANACHAMAGPALYIHIIPFLTDLGIDALKAAGMMSIMVGVGIPGRFLGGFLADRIKRRQLRFVMTGAYLLQAAGLTVFLLVRSVAAIYAWFILFGVGAGIGIGLMFPMRARYFGRKAFGSISGSSSLFMTPVGVVAPVYFGWVYDTTGSYLTGFSVVAVLLAFSVLIAVFVLPPKPPARITELHQFI